MESGGWIRRRPALVIGASFGLGLLITLIADWAGPVAAVLALAVLLLGGRALYPRVTRSPAGEQERCRELVARADEQHRWTARGDLRGVYGSEGAALMRTVTPPQPIVPPGADLEVATVVDTPAALTELLERKLPCWRYAAFVSVLAQRREAVRRALLDARTGFSAKPAETLRSELEAGLFFTDRLAELCRLIECVDGYMLSPAFQGVFGDREESADAQGIVHAGHRLMDFHDELLDLNRRCREVAVPPSCAELRQDMVGLTLAPINGFRCFIDTFIDRVAETADVARYATGDIELDPVTLAVADNGPLIERVSQRLTAIANCG